MSYSDNLKRLLNHVQLSQFTVLLWSYFDTIFLWFSVLGYMLFMFGDYVNLLVCLYSVNFAIGLVHRSQISNTLVDDPNEVLTVREKVFCKVISAEVCAYVSLSRCCNWVLYVQPCITATLVYYFMQFFDEIDAKWLALLACSDCLPRYLNTHIFYRSTANYCLSWYLNTQVFFYCTWHVHCTILKYACFLTNAFHKIITLHL